MRPRYLLFLALLWGGVLFAGCTRPLPPSMRDGSHRIVGEHQAVATEAFSRQSEPPTKEVSDAQGSETASDPGIPQSDSLDDLPSPSRHPFFPSVSVTSLDWRVTLPQIGIDAPIVAVGLEPDGAMGAPIGPDEVGWYRYGPLPGQPGNVLLDGHVDWTDPATGRPRTAVFWDLTRLDAGSQIVISRGGERYVYAVTEKRRYKWDDPEGVTVLQPSVDARITLITCGGTFDRSTRNYSMREVVIAQLVS